MSLHGKVSISCVFQNSYKVKISLLVQNFISCGLVIHDIDRYADSKNFYEMFCFITCFWLFAVSFRSNILLDPLHQCVLSNTISLQLTLIEETTVFRILSRPWCTDGLWDPCKFHLNSGAQTAQRPWFNRIASAPTILIIALLPTSLIGSEQRRDNAGSKCWEDASALKKFRLL